MDGFDIVDRRSASDVLPNAPPGNTRRGVPLGGGRGVVRRCRHAAVQRPPQQPGDALHRGVRRVRPGFADGLRCDDLGNVWSNAADGVHRIDPSGRLLGKLKVPVTVSTLRFGGRDRSRLFIRASQTLDAIHTNRRGVTLP